MKRRFFIPSVILLTLVFGTCLWKNWKSAKERAGSSHTGSPSEEWSLQSNLSFRSSQTLTASVSPGSKANIEAVQTEAKRGLTKEESVVFEMQRANQPIRFYGKVVDQNDNPVPGVNIRLRYTRHLLVGPGVLSEDNPVIDLASDADGKFELTGASGSRLSIEGVGKSGYELSPKAQLTFSGKNPDPILIKLWKRQGADRLMMGDKLYGIVPDGRIYTLDLLTHKKLEGDQATGDLKVTIRRPEKIARKTNFDWTFTIDGTGGGVLESDDEFKNLAPETGYQAHYEFNMPASSPEWVPQVRKEFFFRSRDGKIYGRMTVEVLPDYRDKSAFSVKYAVNPTGSRNLEYDYRQSTSTENHFPPE